MGQASNKRRTSGVVATTDSPRPGCASPRCEGGEGEGACASCDTRRRREELVRPRLDRVAERASLTKRERAVLGLLAEGLGNRGVAATLGISVRTVESHLDSVYDKLGVGTRAAAIAILLEA